MRVRRRKGEAVERPRREDEPQAQGKLRVMLVVSAVIAVLALVAVGCGDDSSDESAGSATTEAATDAPEQNPLLPPPPENTDGANVEEAQQVVLDAIEAAANFEGPGGPIDVSKVDKPIWFLSCGGGNPFCEATGRGFEEAAEEAGVEAKVYVTEATPEANAAAIETAVAQGAGVIALGSLDTKTLKEPIAQAKAKGVKIMTKTADDSAATLPSDIDASVSYSFTDAGKVSAAYAVAKLGGDTAGYCANTETYPVVVATCEGFKAELARLCPDCPYDEDNYVVSTLARDVPAGIQAALRRDPDTNYIMCGYDYLCSFVVPTVEGMGKEGEVWAGSQTGSLTPNVQWVAEGRVQIEDAGLSAAMTGWAVFDQALRLATGAPIAENAGNIPITVFTHETLAARDGLVFDYAEAGAEANVYGQADEAFKDVYKELWQR